MEINSSCQRFRYPKVSEPQVRVVLEKDHRHLYRTGLTQAESVACGLTGESVLKHGARLFGSLQIAGVLDFVERRDGSRHGDGLKPIRPGHKGALYRGARLLGTSECGKSMSIS